MSSLCEVPIGNYSRLDCPDYTKGRINAFAWIDCATTITDFSDATQWNTDISSGLVKVFSGDGINGNIPDGSVVEQDDPTPCRGPIPTSVDMVANIMIHNVTDLNNTFIQTLNGKPGFFAYRRCGSSQIEIVSGIEDGAGREDSVCTFMFTPPNIPDNDNDYRRYAGTVKWKPDIDNLPLIVDEPALIFD